MNEAHDSGLGTAPAPQRHRGATDEEVLAWAERHDLSFWDNLSEARAAFEDAETLHMTYGVQASGEVAALLHIWQSHLGETRDQCDEPGRKLWDRIEAALGVTGTVEGQQK